jgi:acetyltransferase
MEQFHRTLSPDSVYRRYFSMIALGERIRHSRLDHICHPDPREEIVLVAETWNEIEQHEQIVAVARISNAPNATTGELAVVVADAYQGQGIGTELVRRLFDAARRRGLRHIRAEMMADNFQMRRICTRSGMQLGGELCADEVTAYVDL